MTDVIKEVNQLDLFPATANDFEYSIRYSTYEYWHPIILENEDYVCVWWDCQRVGLVPKEHLSAYEIKRNPDYKG